MTDSGRSSLSCVTPITTAVQSYTRPTAGTALVVGVLMGSRLSLNPLGWLVALLLLAVFAVGFSLL